MESQSLPIGFTIQHGGADLSLRLPELGDVEALVEACQDPEIARWTTVPSPYLASNGVEFVELAAAKWGQRRGCEFLITAGGNHPLAHLAIVGACGFNISWTDDTAEIGYWIHREARGVGLAATATRYICQYLFELGIERIEADVIAGNIGSGAVLTKVGFQLEGTLRSTAAGACGVGADRIDLERYGMLPGELNVT